MTAVKKPVAGELDGLDTTIAGTTNNFAMSGHDHTAIMEYVHDLENRLFVSESKRMALFGEFIFLLRDQPHAWCVWHIENFHSKRLPESVMDDVRRELRIPKKVAV